ncbi:fumarylacetoacetate hydrolase family protein [Herbaspirillum sp. WKF16]|uniref:2-keto-4-pentenoate hydratase n=1 Tax=Herbaspirillum sp. WKF16 TaxID=3028312 RepID=UPI0023A925EA|nr:fumarylacetoacetate hydrolase family protein [Herbaspirillum sp. WKF16]WDZ97403.1 fumarylacetoacetate hydrolase family protein [Herbaspirillum sp. WKF16]
MNIHAATQLLLDARNSGVVLDWRRLAVGDAATAYAVQDAQLLQLGPVGGWKVGSKGDGAEPACSPLPASCVLASGALLAGPQWRLRGLEVELALRVGRDFDPGDTLPAREELQGVFDAVMPAIEVVETRLGKLPCDNPWAAMADLQCHGALVIGAARPMPATVLELRDVLASLSIDGREEVRARGGNPADLWPTLSWLARHCALRGMPWKKGQVVTTGSCTGLHNARSGTLVEARLEGVGAVSLRFAG